MEFGYVPLDVIIDEVAGELKSLNRRGGFSKDDAYGQAVEAAGLIGGHNYEDASIAIPIRNHIGVLPKGFVSATEVYQIVEVAGNPGTIIGAFKATIEQTTTTGQTRPSPLVSTNSAETCFKIVGILTPGDSSTVRLLGDMARQSKAYLSDTYVFKRPPGVIRTSFKSGWVGLKFLQLPTENGFICIQDEPNYIKAVKSYIKLMQLQDGFYEGEVPAGVYDRIQNDYDTYSNQARGIQKLPDPAHIDMYVAAVANRYRRFNLR